MASKFFCGRNKFFIVPFWVFPDFERKTFQTFKIKNLPKLPSTCQIKNCGKFVAWIFKFWIVSDFLQKNYSSTCPVFFCFLFRNNFLWLQKVVKNLLRVFSKFFKSFEPFWIFCRNLWHGSQISIYVSRVKIAEETVFLFFFSQFFRILSEKFFRLLAKNLQKVVKTTFCVSRGTICGLKYFFLNRFGFSAETFGMVLKIYLCVQSKNCGRNSFLIFLFRIFPDFERKIFQTFGRKTSSKLPSTCPEEQFVAWIFKFWIVSDFLQKPLAWFSKFYLRVQIKNCGKNSFFFFLFRIFSIFEQNFFRLLANSSKSCENYLLRVHRNNLWLQNFLKQFEPFWIFCRNLWHVSQISIYVSRVKIAEETVFLFFFSVFSDFERKIFQTFGEKSSKSCQNYLLRVHRNNLWLEIFFESFESFWYFLQKPLAWFSNFHLRVQSKNWGRNSFLIFLFRIFSDFERKFFQTFSQKTSKSPQNYLLRVQRNSLWLEIFF